MTEKTVDTIDATELCQIATAYLRRAGLDEVTAAIVAEALVDADIRGHSSHGVGLLPIYASRVRAGGIRANAKPTYVRLGPASFRIDAHGGPGQLAMREATILAARSAADDGVSCVAVGNNNHVGMLAAYRHPFVEHNSVGIIFNISGPSVAPPAGTRATMGNNALCCIMPAEDPRFPFIVDLATGTVACGKIRVAAARGERIPPGWLVDKNGVETTDPADLDAGGAVPVFGDYKGLAISVMVEILAGILGGSTVSPLVSRQRHVPDQAMGCSQLVIGIRMSDEVSSGRGAYLLSRLRRAVDASYDSTPPAIRFPEQQERMIVEQSTCEGVQVSRSTMDTIRADACD